MFQSPEKNTKKAIKKIQEGRGSQKLVDLLNKNIIEHPELIEDISSGLLGIIRTKKNESSSFCIDVLVNIARKKPELFTQSAETFLIIIKNSKIKKNIKSTLQALEIFNIIITRQTEFMQPAVPVIIELLNDSNAHIRLAAYRILDNIATQHPDLFADHTLDMIRSLHGLNVDERKYAARLLRKIAGYSSDEILDEVKSENDDFAALADELTSMIEDTDFEAYASEMLKSIGMGDSIVKQNDEKSFSQQTDMTIEVIDDIFNECSNEEWIKSISLATRDGRIIASRGPESLDKTIIEKICGLLSFKEFMPKKEGFNNRVYIELSDKFIIAISSDIDYILVVSTGPEVQIGIALNEIEKIEKKIKKNYTIQ